MPLPRRIAHLTLNTGHTRMSPRDEVGAEAMMVLRPFLTAGDHRLPATIGDYRLKVTPLDGAIVATVFHNQPDRPLVTFGVVGERVAAASTWRFMESHYLKLTELPGLRSADFGPTPKRPANVPWLAAVTILALPDEAVWLADLERCFAWCWLEEHERAKQQDASTRN